MTLALLSQDPADSHTAIDVYSNEFREIAEAELAAAFSEELSRHRLAGHGWEVAAMRRLATLEDYQRLKWNVQFGEPNDRIMACTILGLVCVHGAAHRVAVELLESLSDTEVVVNEYEYGGIQCEDDEPATVLYDVVSASLTNLHDGQTPVSDMPGFWN